LSFDYLRLVELYIDLAKKFDQTKKKFDQNSIKQRLKVARELR
jgi:hypothetical protein